MCSQLLQPLGLGGLEEIVTKLQLYLQAIGQALGYNLQ